MNVRLVLRLLGGLLLFLAGTLLLPLPLGWLDGDHTPLEFFLSAAATGGVGMVLLLAFPAGGEITYREGFAIVAFGWLAFAVFGGLPFWLAGNCGPIDAFFEAASGFTTTGATIFADLEALPRSIVLWRAISHWLGGMGIIVLGLAILPLLGVGGMQLYQAEVPGPTADRLLPRMQDTAKVLWGVYVLLTCAEILLLMFPGGMDWFDATCHAFATLATGGFSTENASVGAYGTTVQVIILFFMLVAGVSFAMHFSALRGRAHVYWKSQELRFFLGVLGAATTVVFLANVAAGSQGERPLLDAAFQVVSIVTTTGFATADYERWPVLSQYVLVALMFLGGCAGSTGGGMKTVRVMLVLKHGWMQLVRLVHPREIKLLKLDHAVVPDDVTRSILGFCALYSAVFVVGSFAMAALGLDLVTAGAASVACLSNVGPGLGELGPTDTYAPLPAAAKVVMALLMILGRLELFTVLVLFLPSTWRK